jgi:dihydropteroate synthase
MQTTTLRCGTRLLDIEQPVIMGILNVTPDSFYDGGRFLDVEMSLRQAHSMLQEGASVIDVGGASSRPGAAEVPVQDELERVLPVIRRLAEELPEAIISVDTWRAEVAAQAVAAGAHIVNDISGGQFDAEFLPTVAKLGVPYILMHTLGRPDTMQNDPQYDDVVREVLDYFIATSQRFCAMGGGDLVLDPGFGFGKTVEHNYTLLRHLDVFRTVTGLPVLAGVSRKSMIYKPLGITPDTALVGTAALHMYALERGARILRVHDVRAAAQVVQLWKLTNGYSL